MRYKKATFEDVKSSTQKWLGGAMDRVDPTTGTGGKKRRMERKKYYFINQAFSQTAPTQKGVNYILLVLHAHFLLF
jgi:hypothetical protein